LGDAKRPGLRNRGDECAKNNVVAMRANKKLGPGRFFG
jgi:hypothetical protein